MALTPGTRFGAYTIVSKIGTGGMGEVYKARDTRLHRDVALKILPRGYQSDPDRLRRFTNEARAASALNHPNILTVYNIDVADAGPFIVTELVEGTTLRQRLQSGALPLHEVVEVASQIALALAAAHDKGIVHGDVKPENVILRPDGYVKVLDFGLATLRPSAVASTAHASLFETMESVRGGTPAYMAPEQIDGLTVDGRADMFALGIVICELGTGTNPFARPSILETLNAIGQTPRPVESAATRLPSDLHRIVIRAVAARADDRYSTMNDLVAELHDVKRRQDILVAPAPEQRSIAVLPFTDISAQKDQEYFCEGMADELNTALSRVDNLRVASRISARRCREVGLDIKEIGRRLNVQAILEGSVRTAGTHVRITVQLTNVSDGYQLWANRYDRDLADIFAIQDEVAAAVVQRLQLRQGDGGDQPVLRQRGTESLAAYQLYLQGRYHWQRRTKGQMAVAMNCFERAIGLDASYAAAHAGLADCYSYMILYGIVPGTAVLPRARASAERAVALDATSADAYVGIANVKFIEWDWLAAERATARACQLNPRLAIAYSRRAHIVVTAGRFNEALELSDRSVELEPDSASIVFLSGLTRLCARQYDRAIELTNRALELDENLVSALWIRTWACAAMGRYDEAIDSANRGRIVSNDQAFFVGLLGDAYGCAGRRADAEAIVRELLRRRELEYVAPVIVGNVLAALEDAERACDWLEEAYRDRNSVLGVMGVFPLYDRVRDHPRFRALLRQMNLPDSSA